ncbi:hypothetical protein Tco_0043963 [Tanacetum coccineum]
MYPRSLQLFLNNQLKNLAEPFNDTYETPNMRRKGKGLSGTVTPLFPSMLVPQVVEGEGSGQPSEPQPPSSTAHPSQEEQVPASGGPPEKVGDEAVHKELGDRVERAATTATSLDAEQDSGNILKTQSTAIPNMPLSQGISTGGSPRCQEAMGVPLLRLGGHTPGSDEGRPNINELMVICTNLSNRVLALETSKTAQDLVIKKLKKKVRKLEKNVDPTP